MSFLLDRAGNLPLSSLALLLRLELLELLVLPLDLRLLGLQLLLHRLILLLARLHLIADQGAADQSYGSTDAGAGTGMTRGAADNAANPAPVRVPIPAPFSLVVNGSEQPMKEAARTITRMVVSFRFICRSSIMVNSIIRPLFLRCPLERRIYSYAILVQVLSNRNHGCSDTSVRIGAAVLFDSVLQLVYGDRAYGIKGVRHIKVVRGHKPGHPMLDDLIGDFVLLIGKVFYFFFRVLHIVTTGPGAHSKSKIATVGVHRSSFG